MLCRRAFYGRDRISVFASGASGNNAAVVYRIKGYRFDSTAGIFSETISTLTVAAGTVEEFAQTGKAYDAIEITVQGTADDTGAIWMELADSLGSL